MSVEHHRTSTTADLVPLGPAPYGEMVIEDLDPAEADAFLAAVLG